MIAADKRPATSRARLGTLALSHVRTRNPMAAVRAAAGTTRWGAWACTCRCSSCTTWACSSPRRAAPAACSSTPATRALRRGLAGVRARAPRSLRELLAHDCRLRGRREGDPLAPARRARRRAAPESSATSTALRPHQIRRRRAAAARPRQTYARRRSAQHFRGFDARSLWASSIPGAKQLARLHLVEQIDLDTLRLLGVFSGSSGGDEAAAIDLVDLLRRLPIGRRQRRRQLLARSLAERARDQARVRRADVRGRRLRVDGAARQPRLARALRVRLGRGSVRAQGHRQRALLLRPREAARRRAAPALHPRRQLASMRGRGRCSRAASR